MDTPIPGSGTSQGAALACQVAGQMKSISGGKHKAQILPVAEMPQTVRPACPAPRP